MTSVFSSAATVRTLTRGSRSVTAAAPSTTATRSPRHSSSAGSTPRATARPGIKDKASLSASAVAVAATSVLLLTVGCWEQHRERGRGLAANPDDTQEDPADRRATRLPPYGVNVPTMTTETMTTTIMILSPPSFSLPPGRSSSSLLFEAAGAATSSSTFKWHRTLSLVLRGGLGSRAVRVSRCEEREDEENENNNEQLHRFEVRYPTGYTEPERFAQALEYHRSLLFDYLRRWETSVTNHKNNNDAPEQPMEPPRSRNHLNHRHHQQKQQLQDCDKPPLGDQRAAADTGGARSAAGLGSLPLPLPSSSSSSWPRNVPDEAEVPALEFDLQFCRKQRKQRLQQQQRRSRSESRSNHVDTSPSNSLMYLAASSPADLRRGPDTDAEAVAVAAAAGATTMVRDVCQNVEFRVATYYLSRAGHRDDVRRGFLMVKELAEQGHPDGMCLYGMILMDGPDRVPEIRRRPEEAVRWLQKAAALHRHIVATYELGVAHYTGDGTPAPDPGHAIRLFQQAAHLGHPGAAYMLGECLLDGVGCDRDRASALEWLLTAAELGHGLARERALMVLLEDHTRLVQEATSHEHVEAGRRNEALKWLEGRSEEAVINLERRHTLGGSASGIKVPSRSAAVRERRMSKVRESRDESNVLYHAPDVPRGNRYDGSNDDGLPSAEPDPHPSDIPTDGRRG